MKKCCLFGAALLCCALFVSAEESVTLREVVVTPAGSESDAFDSALPVSVFTAKDVDDAIAFSMSELPKMEPGVDAVTAGPGSIHPMIRGLSGERVLVLVDGIRLSEQRPGGNHAFSLDPAQIATPGRDLYGVARGLLQSLRERARLFLPFP